MMFSTLLLQVLVDNDKNYIAYPGSSQNGEVQVFDVINLVCLKQILYYYVML